MSFYIQNNFYVSYVKQIAKDINFPPKKFSQKVQSLVIRVFGKLLLGSKERKSIQEALLLKPVPRKSTILLGMGAENLPPVDFLNLEVKKEYPLGYKRHLDVPICKAVLENDLNAFKTSFSNSPLKQKQIAFFLAIRLNRLEFLEFVKQNGFTKKQKLQGMAYAIRKGQTTSIRYFLQNGVNVNTRIQGRSLLAQAFINGKFDAAKLLIELGGKFETKNKDLINVYLKMIKSDKQLAELFLQCLPKSSYPKQKELLFVLARKFGFKELLKELIDLKLDIAKLDQKNDSLSLPVFEEHEEIVKLLLKHGAKASKPGSFALIEAVGIESLPLVKLLLDHHANVEQFSGCTPLTEAHLKRNPELIDLLVQRGANKVLSEHLHCQKMLAHRFALKGKLKFKGAYKEKLEGYHSLAGARALEQSVTEFFANPENHAKAGFPNQESREKIVKAVRDIPNHFFGDSTDEAILAKYNAGEMVVIRSGWNGHCTYRLLYRGYCIEINLGALLSSQLSPGYQIHSIGAPLTAKIIGKMRREEISKRKETEVIRSKVHRKLMLKLLCMGEFSKQEAGVCVWDSAKALFRMMLYIDALEKNRLEGQNELKDWLRNADEKSTEIYELFFHQDSKASIHEAMHIFKDTPTKELHVPMLNAILGKFKGDHQTSLELAQFLKKHKIRWRSRRVLTHFIRRSRNHTLIPLLAKHRLI